MKNPYDVLGISENASEEEIKRAYREQVKKYHPDRYDDNPLKDLAEEKMREINEAYDYILKNVSTGTKGYSQSGYQTRNNYSNSGTRNSSSYNNIRNYINMNNLRAAEDELNRIGYKDAEWFYLRGIISMKKGWYSQGYQDLQTAVNMDPSNFEYREALNRAMNSNRMYTDNTYYRSSNNNSNDWCSLCTCLCCTDQCCECMGGDFISCC